MMKRSILASVVLGLAVFPMAGSVGAAEENDLEKVFSSIGSFVSKGLGPARTLDDVEREEVQRRQGHDDEPAPAPKKKSDKGGGTDPHHEPASAGAAPTAGGKATHGKPHVVEKVSVEPLVIKSDPEPAPLEYPSATVEPPHVPAAVKRPDSKPVVAPPAARPAAPVVSVPPEARPKPPVAPPVAATAVPPAVVSPPAAAAVTPVSPASPASPVAPAPSVATGAVPGGPAVPSNVSAPAAAVASAQPTAAVGVSAPPLSSKSVAPELVGPPSSRIAATATVDQALKLGGASDLYARRVKRGE